VVEQIHSTTRICLRVFYVLGLSQKQFWIDILSIKKDRVINVKKGGRSH